MIKVAMLSGWHVHAKGYARELLATGRVLIKGVWDEVKERGIAWAKELDTEFYEDLDELLNTDIDGVVVNAPTNMHKEIIIKAARAKKHVFTEKVLTAKTVDALEIQKEIENSGIKFVISLPHRTFPKNIYVKEIIDSGVLGEISLFRVRNAHSGASDNWLPPHFYSKEQCGGGAMIDLGAHPMYLIRWLMGKPEKVYSAFTFVTGHEVEDNAVSVFKYKNGAVAIAETGFVTPASPFSMEIYGTKGTLFIDGKDQGVLQSGYLAGKEPKKSGWFKVGSMPKPGKSAIDQWLDAIEYNEPVEFGIKEAVELTEMMDKAYESFEKNTEVDF
jgi:1,5-anhydro-D-fructose reductase (1,5-anhydro-D-mannitol-forming)